MKFFCIVKIEVNQDDAEEIRFIILLLFAHFAFSQNTDSTKIVSHFGGAVTVTNNGISFVPTFSLGKPAVIFDLSMGRRLSFDPQLRFSLEGKPWSFLFWGRYKLLKTNKFSFNVGSHLGLSFKTSTEPINGITTEITTVKRYLAGELVPNYLLTKDISIGMYYLYSRGIDHGTTRNTHFLTLNTSFSDIRLSKQFYMKFTPQVYYLKMDQLDGVYFTSALTLANRKIPLSISSVINKIIQTNITASQNFVWNVSLIYAFNKKYVER
ncbi:MAG TPA: hypothetical protein VFC67_14250 [Prolixibacteraceae bacterium]|nr:hypothetical protein [Prolixibacteraceae bacterium]